MSQFHALESHLSFYRRFLDAGQHEDQFVFRSLFEGPAWYHFFAQHDELFEQYAVIDRQWCLMVLPFLDQFNREQNAEVLQGIPNEAHQLMQEKSTIALQIFWIVRELGDQRTMEYSLPNPGTTFEDTVAYN